MQAARSAKIDNNVNESTAAMVHVSQPAKIERLYAYLTTDLTPEQLNTIHEDFELGSHAKYSPTVELFIRDIKDYRGKSHAEIRRAEDEAGRTRPFLLIDHNAAEQRALWYISEFANENEVEDGAAESTNVVWKILVKTVHVPVAHANYDVGNISIEEDLEIVGGAYPMTEDFDQAQALDYEIDMEEDAFSTLFFVTAEPGEFEESTDETLRKNFLPFPDRVVRLKDDVAGNAGVSTNWMAPSLARKLDMPDGSVKTFPEGSVVLQLTFDRSNPGKPYQRPEGSL